MTIIAVGVHRGDDEESTQSQSNVSIYAAMVDTALVGVLYFQRWTLVGK